MLVACLLSALAGPAAAPTAEPPVVESESVSTPADGADEVAQEPSNERGEALSRRAGRLFVDGRYTEAAAVFVQAYEILGAPPLLFGQAQALRKAGDCASAVEVFERFIAATTVSEDREEARRLVALCRAAMPEPQEASSPIPIEPAPRTPPPRSDPRSNPGADPPRRPGRDVLGGVTVGVGSTLTVLGAVLLGTSHGLASDRSGETEDAWLRRSRTIDSLSVTGVSLLAVGGAALLTGIIRYAVIARRGRRATRSARGEPSSTCYVGTRCTLRAPNVHTRSMRVWVP
jgi:hypothetical protein